MANKVPHYSILLLLQPITTGPHCRIALLRHSLVLINGVRVVIGDSVLFVGWYVIIEWK